jgi:hypothetical protein
MLLGTRSAAALGCRAIILMCSHNGLIRNQLDALEHAIGRYTIGFVFPWQGQQHVPTASGIAVTWADKRIVVTAKHVFEGTGDNEEFLLILPVDRPFERDDQITMPSAQDAKIVARPAAPIIESKSCDLAFFEVNDDFGTSSDLEFYSLPSFARAPGHPAQCVMMGFPEDLAIPLPTIDEALINIAARWSETLDPSEESRFISVKDFDQQSHFLMKFRTANKGKAAPGFSGGGIWFPIKQQQSAQLWRPNPGLAGIQSSWFPKRSTTLAIRVELLVDFLMETLGSAANLPS